MPIYDWFCPECGSRLENEFAKCDDYDRICGVCDSDMKREIGAPRINMGPVPTGGYYDEVLDSYVETKTQWERLCKEKNVTPKGDTPKPEDRA